MNKDVLLSMYKNQQYVNQLKSIPKKFKAEHDDESKTTEITIYGVIGDSWFEESFSASDIDNALKDAGDNDVVIRLNSPGGDAFDGISIYNRLKQHKGKVTVYVDGWACSAASIIAMAGDEVIMGLGSMMMIHEASTIAWGSKTNMRKIVDMLEQLDNGLVDIYASKTSISREDIQNKLEAETWMSADTAVELSFADKLANQNVSETNESSDEKVNNSFSTRTSDEVENTLNELKNILNTDNQEEPLEPVARKRRGFFF